MNIQCLKLISMQLIISLLMMFFLTIFVNKAFADLQPGSLAADAGAIDRYSVSCSANASGDTGRLATQVSNTTNASPLISVQTYKGSEATNSTDLVSGGGDFSPLVFVYGGNGNYFVAVNKSDTGVANYSLQFQCETNEGSATSSAITQLQNQ